MKKEYIIILVSMCFALSCKNKSITPISYPLINDRELIQKDTIFVTKVDTTKLIDTVYLIPDEYLEYELIVRNIKHYVQITEKNSKNRTFFYGWIKRAVTE